MNVILGERRLIRLVKRGEVIFDSFWALNFVFLEFRKGNISISRKLFWERGKCRSVGSVLSWFLGFI